MALKADTKFGGKMICAFKNDMKNFILENKMVELIQMQIDQMQCENFTSEINE